MDPVIIIYLVVDVFVALVYLVVKNSVKNGKKKVKKHRCESVL